MIRSPIDIPISSEQDTRRLARAIGRHLRKGDVLLLEGDIGSGKTSFARALIQSAQDAPEDVPSPTFTLVQVYDTRLGEIWHSDLYRIGSTAEIEELGLTDAFSEAICLVEWPDRLGDLGPADALRIRFDVTDTDKETRKACLEWSDPRWDRVITVLTARMGEASAT
jgi:tRNA threonylcarbamoyladenosine biosynthesis protein TsaE